VPGCEPSCLRGGRQRDSFSIVGAPCRFALARGGSPGGSLRHSGAIRPTPPEKRRNCDSYLKSRPFFDCNPPASSSTGLCVCLPVGLVIVWIGAIDIGSFSPGPPTCCTYGYIRSSSNLRLMMRRIDDAAPPQTIRAQRCPTAQSNGSIAPKVSDSFSRMTAARTYSSTFRPSIAPGSATSR
jgi:hypothetical protein